MSPTAERLPQTNAKGHRPSRWYWYHGAIFYVGVQILTFGLARIVSTLTRYPSKNVRDLFGDVGYFQSLKQVSITPPAWVFGPTWTINNMSTIWGAIRVLNKPPQTPGREEYLALQACSWLNYIIFSAAYFSLRSPINAFLLSLSMLILTILSGLVALLRLHDSVVALSLATLFLWLLVALTAASFQAAWNHDEFYHVGPLAKLIPKLVKPQ